MEQGEPGTCGSGWLQHVMGPGALVVCGVWTLGGLDQPATRMGLPGGLGHRLLAGSWCC
jgi:hypothetical protein